MSRLMISIAMPTCFASSLASNQTTCQVAPPRATSCSRA
jgi:hypothetical protein